MAKEILSKGTESSNYIQQFYDGSTTYDLAVKNGIKFFTGQEDTNGVLWDGSSSLDVVIPSLTDLIKDPIHFVGTVGSDGSIKDENEVTLSEFDKGSLVFFVADCSAFEITTGVTVACEAGDMAVYDGLKWNVVTGENQVTVQGTVNGNDYTTLLSGTPATVLGVEGKNLKLGIDYSDVRSKISLGLSKNTDNTINVSNGTVTVAPKYVALSQAAGTTTDITTSVSIDLPTALADGSVTIADKVLASGDFTFTSGVLPTLSKNASAITVNAAIGSSAVVAIGDGAFVTDVDAIKAVSFENATSGEAAIAYVSGIAASDGTSFVSGVHTHTTADGDTPADFTIPGVVSLTGTSTFATGFGAAAATGDVVSSVTVGEVTGTFVSGLTGGTDSVITGVTFGDVAQDATREWFVTGLADDASAVTAVSFGTVEVTPQTSAAVVSASVSNHVLSFTTGNFMTSATAALSGTGVTTKAFTKGGVNLTGFSKSSDTLATASVSQAATSVSYKSLETASFSLSKDSDTGYHFDKAASATYTAQMGYKKFAFTEADVTKSGAALSNSSITASIPAESVVVAFSNAGTLPTLTIGAPSATISGTVGTALTTSSVSWLAVDPGKKNISTAGAYSLVESSTEITGAVAVAEASTYDVDNATVTIAANTYLTDADVSVDGSTVSKQ